MLRAHAGIRGHDVARCLYLRVVGLCVAVLVVEEEQVVDAAWTDTSEVGVQRQIGRPFVRVDWRSSW